MTSAVDTAISEDVFNAATYEYRVAGSRTLSVRLQQRCGHIEVHVLPVSTTPEALDRVKRGLCSGCALEQAEEQRVVSADNWEIAEILGLPPLEGTAKQNEWANNLRVNAVARHGFEAVMPVVMAVNDVQWWINNRKRLMHLKVFNETKQRLEAGLPVTRS